MESGDRKHVAVKPAKGGPENVPPGTKVSLPRGSEKLAACLVPTLKAEWLCP